MNKELYIYKHLITCRFTNDGGHIYFVSITVCIELTIKKYIYSQPKNYLHT